jgi:hypothetical protein
VLLCFLLLGITGQIYTSNQTEEGKKDFRDNLHFWVGANGIFLSALLYTTLILFIIGLVLFIKQAPYLQSDFRKYGDSVITKVNDVSAKIVKLSDSADDLIKKIPEIIGNSLTVMSQGTSLADKVIQGGKGIAGNAISGVASELLRNGPAGQVMKGVAGKVMKGAANLLLEE